MHLASTRDVAVLAEFCDARIDLDTIVAKNIDGRLLCESSSTSAILKQLKLGKRMYLQLHKLFSVAQYLRQHRSPPPSTPASAWLACHDRYQQHVKTFEEHGVSAVMMECLEAEFCETTLGFDDIVELEQLRADYVAANHPHMK